MPEGQWAGGRDIANIHTAMLDFIEQPSVEQQPPPTEWQEAHQEQDDWLGIPQVKWQVLPSGVGQPCGNEHALAFSLLSLRYT